MALVGVRPGGGLLALFSLLFGFGGFWKQDTVSGAGTGGGKVALFAPLVALAKGAFEKLAELPRWPGFRHMVPTGDSPEGGTAVLGGGSSVLQLVGSSGNIQRRALSSSRQPSRML